MKNENDKAVWRETHDEFLPEKLSSDWGKRFPSSNARFEHEHHGRGGRHRPHKDDDHGREPE